MDLQTLIVGCLVALAAGFVTRKLYRNFKGEGDGTCDKCVPKGNGKKVEAAKVM